MQFRSTQNSASSSPAIIVQRSRQWVREHVVLSSSILQDFLSNVRCHIARPNSSRNTFCRGGDMCIAQHLCSLWIQWEPRLSNPSFMVAFPSPPAAKRRSWTCRKYPTERQSWYVITYAAMTSTVVSSLLTARFTTWGGRCAGNTLSPEWPRCTCPQQERQWVCALCHLWHSAGTTYHWGCFTTSYCAIRATEMSIIRHVPG